MAAPQCKTQLNKKIMEIKIENELLSAAIRKYGVKEQQFMIVEETAELLDALAKYRRKRVPASKVKEEIADVFIMLGQLMLMLPPTESSEVEDFIKYKLARLKNRLQESQPTTAEMDDEAVPTLAIRD